MPRYTNSPKYSAQRSSEIRCNIMGALQDGATFTGIDIQAMQKIPPYSMILAETTPQKIASELKKMIDMGLVVKGVVRGKTVKYMLADTFQKLEREGKVEHRSYGFGNDLDLKDRTDEQIEEETTRVICERIALTSDREVPVEMW